MGVVTSSSFAKSLYPGVSSWFGMEYNDWEELYPDLFDTYTSRRAYEEDVGTVGLGLAQKKSEGKSITYDETSQGFITRYSHTVWGKGIIFTRESIEDDLYDVVGPAKAKGLARSLRQTKEINAANVYNRAFSSSYLGGDGVELCSLVHPNFSGGTWANESSTSASLSEAAVEQACIDIMKWTDDRGLKIRALPVSLHIPVDLIWEAERLFKTPNRVGTANNDISALYSKGIFKSGVKDNIYFSSTTAWFIRTNVPNGMKYWSRRKMEFDIDNDFATENALYKATERYSFGWTDPRAIYGSAGA
jgi:hypothetical protein